MTPPLPACARLNPRRSPGRSDRKASRYVHEVRRLRAEGHTLESIREALLDVGVAVSEGTVRRELARPVTQWELDRRHEGALASEPTRPDATAAAITPAPQPLDANRAQPDDGADRAGAAARHEALNERMPRGALSTILWAVQRLCRGRRFR